MKKPMLRKFRIAKAMEVLDVEDINKVDPMLTIDTFKELLPLLTFNELSSFHTIGRRIYPIHDTVGHLIDSVNELTESIASGNVTSSPNKTSKEVDYYTWATAPQNKQGANSREELARELDSALSDLIRACCISKAAENSLVRRLYPVAHDLVILAKECVKDNQ